MSPEFGHKPRTRIVEVVGRVALAQVELRHDLLRGFNQRVVSCENKERSLIKASMNTRAGDKLFKSPIVSQGQLRHTPLSQSIENYTLERPSTIHTSITAVCARSALETTNEIETATLFEAKKGTHFGQRTTKTQR